MSDSDRIDPSTRSLRRPEEETGASRSREPDPRRHEPHLDDRGYDHEVSVRDLYLILVRGLPAILMVAVFAGAAAFVVSTVRPSSYVAEATVMSSPPSVRFREDPTVILGADEDGASTVLALRPPEGIPLEAYRAIAVSRDVLERTRSLLGDAAPELDALLGAAEVRRADGSGTSLMVLHRVAWTDPEAASAYANAWADMTVERVRQTLVADLEPTIRITQATVSQRLAALEAAEAELMAVARDDGAAAASRELARLEREVAAARRAYAVVAGLEPTLTYLAELVPSGTRVLETAAPPTESTGPSRALLTALATVLGAMVATLGVFLREAVRDPDARAEPGAGSAARAGARTGA